MSDRIGTDFGRYRIESLLGKGGMGEVYRAFDTEKSRTVALKLLPEQLAGDPGFRARFDREARTAAQLDDPHVIPIHDFGEIDGSLYLDMRLVTGRDLRSVIAQDGPLDPQRAVRIVGEVASAVDAAHRAGLIHRDIKPENILVTDADFAYLVDFGLAHSTGDTRMTKTGAAVGSFGYMAPERFGDADLTPAVDIYGLACVLYEALTGDAPYPSSSFEQIIAGHLYAPIPRTGGPLDTVLAAGLAKDPAQRFATGSAFIAAARAALAGETAVLPAHTPPTAIRPAAIPPAAVRPAPVHPTAVHPAAIQPAATRQTPAPRGAAHQPTRQQSYPPPPSAPPALSYPPGYPPAQPPPIVVAQPQGRSPLGWIVAAVVAVLAIAGGIIAWQVIESRSDADSTAAHTPSPTTTTTPGSAAPGAAVTPAPTGRAAPGAAPEPTTAASPVPDQSRPQGDLGLSVPMTVPACDGSTILVVYNAVTPGAYASEIAAALDRYPGAQYLRTDSSCASLKQHENGNPIYAVFFADDSLAATCARKAGHDGAYARRLDDSTPVGTEIC